MDQAKIREVVASLKGLSEAMLEQVDEQIADPDGICVSDLDAKLQELNGKAFELGEIVAAPRPASPLP